MPVEKAATVFLFCLELCYLGATLSPLLDPNAFPRIIGHWLPAGPGPPVQGQSHFTPSWIASPRCLPVPGHPFKVKAASPLAG